MGPFRVLLVDDDQEFRTVLRATLDSDSRFDVVDEATDGQQALALATFHQPDVVVMDLMMPELDGLVAAPLIRKEAPKSIIAMLSSREARAAEQISLGAGVDLFIEKQSLPMVPDLLADFIQARTA